MSLDVAAPPAASRIESPRRVQRDAPPRRLRRAQFDFDVAIVGLGYVGLPTALAMHAQGLRVLGVDASDRRLSEIRSASADLLETDRRRLNTALLSDGFALTNDSTRLSGSAAVIICVPTPIDEYSTPDLAILRAACATVVEAAVPGQLILLTSTTYVGCTRDLLVGPLRLRGLDAGKDVLVAFSPERIDPGNEGFAHEDVPRVVGGSTRKCLLAAEALLHRYAHNVHTVSSLEAAEMTKLLENTFRAVNIALANEFAEACTALELPVLEIINAAATKPYGFMPFFPGPGVGGHCIPCDPHYLLWQLRKDHINLPVIELAMSEIASRPRRVVERIRQILASRSTALAGARVLVVGVSYKPDVADLRESPALEILRLLRAGGADVGYLDPYFESVMMPDGLELYGVSNPVEFHADIVLLHTDHASFDTSWMSSAEAVLDTTYRRTDLEHAFVL